MKPDHRKDKLGRWKWPYKPFNPYGGAEYARVTQQNTNEAIAIALSMPYEDLLNVADESKNAALIKVFSSCIVGDVERKDLRSTNKLLDRLLGRAQQNILVTPNMPSGLASGVLSFADFCLKAGYPCPYPMQNEMREFAMHTPGAHMILGSRGYGKTDYVVILGYAYEMYLDYLEAKDEKRPPEETCLLVTKSRERNAAIMDEVLKAGLANGIPFEKQGSSGLRVEGLLGKDHSMSAITIGAASIRGRHPKRVIMDDPVTEDDVSEATRNKAQRVYNELSKLTDDILIIGQPVHKWDLYEVLRPLEGVKKMEVPHGSIPELDHDLEAQRLAGVAEESIQASYFLKVVSEVGNPFENVKYVDDFSKGDCVAFIDPSFEGGDYTAISCVRAYFDGVIVFGKVWKRAWYNCVDEIAAVIAERGVKKLAFETNCLGEQPVTLLRTVLEDDVGVVGRKSLDNKHARISAVGPFAPQIHIARTSDRLYIDQTTKYEYGAKNDDAPDSLASCLTWIGLIRGRS